LGTRQAVRHLPGPSSTAQHARTTGRRQSATGSARQTRRGLSAKNARRSASARIPGRKVTENNDLTDSTDVERAEKRHSGEGTCAYHTTVWSIPTRTMCARITLNVIRAPFRVRVGVHCLPCLGRRATASAPTLFPRGCPSGRGLHSSTFRLN
jgi:hypothetical protein